MDTLPNRGDFFNRREPRQDSDGRRHYRPPVDQIPTAAELAALMLRRRHRIPQRLARVVVDLAGLGGRATA